MNDNDKTDAIDALIELLGWRAVCHMVPAPRMLRYYYPMPGRPNSLGMMNLREDYRPSHGPWYWKPALFDVLLAEGKV